MSTGITQSIVDQQKWLDGLSDAVQPIFGGLFTNAGEAGRLAKDLLNGVWLGHPLHPLITDVPIGAWTMTQLFDVMSMARGGDDSLDAASDVTLGMVSWQLWERRSPASPTGATSTPTTPRSGAWAPRMD